MRFIALAALAVFAVGLMDARPASAAHRCENAQVCSKHAVKKAHYKKSAHRAHKERAAKTSYKYSKKNYSKVQTTPTKRAAAHRAAARKAASASYGGGSTGIASYYWQGQITASGARFYPIAMTAAHRTLPFGTRVLVTNQSNGRSVTVTINDRGPFIKGRIIDLSKAAAGAIGMQGAGLARVSISVLGRG